MMLRPREAASREKIAGWKGEVGELADCGGGARVFHGAIRVGVHVFGEADEVRAIAGLASRKKAAWSKNSEGPHGPHRELDDADADAAVATGWGMDSGDAMGRGLNRRAAGCGGRLPRRSPAN